MRTGGLYSCRCGAEIEREKMHFAPSAHIMFMRRARPHYIYVERIQWKACFFPLSHSPEQVPRKKNRDVLVCYQRFLCTGCTRKKRKRNNAALFIIALIFFSVMLLSLIDLILHRIVSITHQILNLRIRHRKLYTRIPFKSSAWCKRRSSLHKVHLYYALNINFFRRLKEVPHWSWHNYTDTHTRTTHIHVNDVKMLCRCADESGEKWNL